MSIIKCFQIVIQDRIAQMFVLFHILAWTLITLFMPSNGDAGNYNIFKYPFYYIIMYLIDLPVMILNGKFFSFFIPANILDLGFCLVDSLTIDLSWLLLPTYFTKTV